MAGMGMRDIKRRIKSVNSTKQITKAMEMVSSSKLRKARIKLEKNRLYFKTVRLTIEDIIANVGNIKNQYVEGAREIKKTGYIVVTADRGLCGGFNSNVIKETLLNMKDKDHSKVIAIGKKAKDVFQRRDCEVVASYTNILENIEFAEAKEISRLATKLYDDGEIDELYFIYTNFLSTISQKAEAIRLLPLSNSVKADEDESQKDQKEFEYIAYEPSKEGLLNYLIPKYLESTIFGGMVESAASEQGARRVAMESATDNAVEMIDKLTLTYNRARQAAITQEISEIVGGAEALK